MEATTEERPSSNLSLRASELVRTILEVVSNPPSKKDDFPEYEMKNIDWVTCKDFTIDVGKRQIAQYIQTWEVHPSWLYSLEFLRETERELVRQYRYRARWSIPTRRTPIPRGTACVYFVIAISKIKPQSLPVEVYFTVESNRLAHRPGKTRFREKWLKDVIESKALLQDTVDY